MKMLRRFNRNGLWKQLFISGETLEETRFDLRKDNIEIMNQCILDAKEIMGKQNAETFSLSEGSDNQNVIQGGDVSSSRIHG